MLHTTFDTMPSAIDEIRSGQSRLEELVGKLLNQQSEQEKEEFINLRKVCELTGYATATVYGLVGANKIPHFKRGQRLFFERASILLWIKESRHKSKAEIEAAADEHLKTLKIKR